MKYREVILDFTSLLDIIMIILFFFILFSTFDVETAAEKAQQKQEEYETFISETQEEQNQWQEKADKEWKRLQQSDQTASDNLQALIAFDQGNMLSLSLQDIERSDKWTLSITENQKKITALSAESGEKLKQDLKAVFEQYGLNNGEVILCVLTYDGYSYGTEQAVPEIEKAVRDLQKDYVNLYFTTINISK